MFRHILVALFIAAFAVSAVRAADRDCDKTPFTDFLFSVGDKLDCYFTLETWRRGEQHPSSFYDAQSPSEKIASIDALLAKVKRDLPGVTVVRDSRNDRIIHLIDAGLLSASRYALDKQASVDFAGPLEDLPDSFGTELSYVVGRSDPLGCDFQNDVVTMVKVHFEEKTIRQILTDAVPLKKYGRILWIAQTFQKNDGELNTDITYVGPKLNSAIGQNEGAIAQISLPPEYTFGRPMPATVVIRNTSNKSFLCITMYGLPNDKMEMKLVNRNTGAVVPMTKQGRQVIEFITTRGGSRGLGRLKKGQPLTRQMKLEDFYAPPPGRYKFTAKFHLHRESDHEDIPVTVGPIDFVVAK